MRYTLTMSYPRATLLVLTVILATFGSAMIGRQLYGFTGAMLGLAIGIAAVLAALRIHNHTKAQP